MKQNEIHVAYGTDHLQMTMELLAAMDIAGELHSGMSVAIKPNLVVAKEARTGATTTPAVVEGIIRYLQSHGITNISIMEGSWVGDDTKRAFAVAGYRALADKYGLPLYDLKEDEYVVRRAGPFDMQVCRKPLEAHYLINVPVLKAHCQTQLTCALKNLKGCLTDSEKRRFHRLGLMKPIGCLGKAVRPALTVVDAIAGDLTFEEGGNPVPMNRIFAGRDMVLLDAYAASLLGFTTGDIEYIGIAEAEGVGSADLSQAVIREYHRNLKESLTFKSPGQALLLTRQVVAREACSACYGSLIHALQRLRDKGYLSSLQQPIHIGQGFQDQKVAGLGIGSCAQGCDAYLPGCPPTARDMVHFLEQAIVKGKPHKRTK